MGKKVSIITVTYNSEETLPYTIESILNQTNGKIEYLIIDGASKDKTVEVAESYRLRLEERGIDYTIVSEPDGGIYDAMNKGIKLSTGDIIGILNSSDKYESDTVKTVVEEFEKNDCDLLFSNIRMVKTDGTEFVKKARLRRFQTSRDWNHPTMFVKSEVYKDNLFRDKGIHDDYGCYLQMLKKGYSIKVVDKVLATFTMGGASNHKSFKEARRRIHDRYKWCYRVNGYSRLYFIECVAIEAAKMILG